MIAYRKTAHPTHKGGYQGWEETEVYDTLNAFDNTESRIPIVLVWNGKADGSTGNGVAFSIIGDHDNRPTDMTNVIIQYEKQDIC